MSEYDPKKYLPTIDAILSVANLEEITVKKIRNALQELFGIDLKVHKKDINEIILGRYYDLVDKRKDEEYDAKERLKEIEKQDALLAARLSKSTVQGPIMRARKATVKRTKKVVSNSDDKKVVSNTGFNRELILSNELGNVLGTSKLSRPQVVKQLWAYIKDNQLQNPSDKRQILCDEKLQLVFKKKTVGAFEMNKILSSHIFKPEEVEKSNSKVSGGGAIKNEIIHDRSTSSPSTSSPSSSRDPSDQSEAE